MPESTLREILIMAVYAPSGDNAQPWEFEIRNSNLLIFNKPESDGTLYNFRQRGSYVAHGALIENIVLLSAREGYEALVELFPSDKEQHCTARIAFRASETTPQPLCDVISKRSTNRKPYSAKPLESQHRQTLIHAGSLQQGVTLDLVEEKFLLKELARILSLNERLLMENRPLHDFLFSMIRWSQKDEAARPGLYVKTMELPPPVRFLFKHVLCHWLWVRVLNVFGFSRAISLQTANLYSSSAAIGIISISSEQNASFVAAGRALQEVWLTATHCGLSLQPVTALPYLSQRVQAGEADAFSPEHQAAIEDASGRIRKLCALEDGRSIAMIFRVGYGATPSAYSAKQAPIIRMQQH